MTSTVAADAVPASLGRLRTRTTWPRPHVNTAAAEQAAADLLIEAEHTCMSLRGARAAGAGTTTSALFGQLRDDPRSRAEFLSLTKGSR